MSKYCWVDSNGVKLYWFPLIVFLGLPFAIRMSLVLTVLGILDWSRPPSRQVELSILGYSRSSGIQSVLPLLRACLWCPWLKQASSCPSGSKLPEFLFIAVLLADRKSCGLREQDHMGPGGRPACSSLPLMTSSSGEREQIMEGSRSSEKRHNYFFKCLATGSVTTDQ